MAWLPSCWLVGKGMPECLRVRVCVRVCTRMLGGGLHSRDLGQPLWPLRAPRRLGTFNQRLEGKESGLGGPGEPDRGLPLIPPP